MKLTWTIKEQHIDFPSDDRLYEFAKQIPARDARHIVFHMVGTQFHVERFGHSARVYILDANGAYESVGLFTWGMSKADVQKYSS